MGGHECGEQRGETVPDRLTSNAVANDGHTSGTTKQLKKSPNCRLKLQVGGCSPLIMGKAIGSMTALLGAYMTFKMWAEFNDALGTLFGASWAVIISTLVFLIYQSNKNDKLYESQFGNNNPEHNAMLKNIEDENSPPVMFVAGLYLFVLVVFEILLGSI